MRVLSWLGNTKILSPEVYSVIQLHVNNEPLLPNLTTLNFWDIKEPLIPFIFLFLSPTITSISFGPLFSQFPKSVIASLIVNLPTSCPNLQDITLQYLPRDPMIAAAASKMFFATNPNSLRRFHVECPLTEEATEAIYKSQNLHGLSVVIEKGTPISSASLPNLTRLQIECEDGSDGLQLLRGTTSKKLESVGFIIKSSLTDDFLEEFKGVALPLSIQDTLSDIRVFTVRSWNPNYSSLLPFTRLVRLRIPLPCGDDCSGVDDNVLIDLSRAMPNLQELRLTLSPCSQLTGVATAKGLVALARNCRNLSSLCVHFQAASLVDPPAGLETIREAGYSASWTGCALRELDAGFIPVPEGSASMIALTLLRIFPRIETIEFWDDGWREVADMICRSKEIVDFSGTYHHLVISQNPC